MKTCLTHAYMESRNTAKNDDRGDDDIVESWMLEHICIIVKSWKS